MRKTRFSEAEIDELRSRTHNGMTMETMLHRGDRATEIARRFHVGTYAVAAVRDAASLPRPKGGRPPRKPRAGSPSLSEAFGVEPLKLANPKGEVNRRELGGMVARVISSPTPPAEPAPVAAATQPARPKSVESTWKVTVRRRLTAAELHRRLQALMALLSETEGDVQADIYVADIVEVGP
ncbi:MAG: hypothetical protein ACYC9Q_14940 [Bacillota bacterium]